MVRVVLLFVISLSLAACSSGSDSGGGGLGKSDNNNNSGGWQQGVFLDWGTFYQQCTNTLDQNNFLRSYTDDTYLWYDEVTDRDPALYGDPLAYFDLLRTTGLSSSGEPKDRFHFTYDTDEWEQLSQSGVSAGYGIQWALLSTTPPRQLLIAYTEPNSPATNIALPLARGAEILAIDGVDVEFGSDVDTLNAGLFPGDVGEQHTFVVRDLGATGTREVTLASANITSTPVRTTDVISTQTGEIGYLLFNDHIATAEQGLIDAVNELNAHAGGTGIDDLVLDIRYNGGGYLAIASELAYMIAGPVPTAGQIFDELRFNDKHPITNPVTGNPLSPTPFYDTALGAPFNGAAGQPLPTLNLGRVYVLTGPGTCSASEAIINGLRGVGVEVIQVGSTTCGKPYGFYPTGNCGTTYFTIQFSGANAVGFGDYSDGFSPANASGPGEDVPGCSVADDFTKQLGDPTEARFAAALAYRDGGTCPAASGFAPGVLGKPGQALNATEVFLPKAPWRTNRLMLP
jgi:C-terminal processing protease CtpA/Prc